MDVTVAAETGPNLVGMGIGFGTLSCFAVLIWLYNLYVAVSMMRDAEAEPASGLAKAAWAVSLVAWLLPPCWFVLGLAGVIMGRIVTGQVYREEASIASNTPAGMASLNFGLLFVVYILAVVIWVVTG